MSPGWLTVSVVYCAPGVEDWSEVRLPQGSAVSDAIAAAKLAARIPGFETSIDAGIWGRRCPLDHPLANGDRVEIYRPLQIDPKEGRRIRAALRRKTRF